MSRLTAAALVAAVTFGALVPTGAGAGEPKKRGHDVYQKIEFSADRLEVEEKNRVATFEGHVEAVQGELRLTADIVRVYFGGGGVDAGDTSEVSRIDATGHVTLTTPDEKAAGEWGIYDVGAKIVTLGGAVMLERGTTVLEGTRLVLDLEQGQSKIESIAGTGKGTRVRGVFMPTKKAGGKDN